MKKNFVYAILSAIALSGAAGFAGCSSSDEIIDNPNYNPETNSVKTQFTISVTKEAGSATRMSEATVQGQATPVFRGLDQMVLIPYGKVTSNDVDDNRIGAGITLNVSGGIANTLPAFSNTNSNSYVYSDVNIPLKTYGFLFYGKAIDATAGTLITSPAEMFTYGYLTPSNLAGEKAYFSFSLKPIHAETSSSTTSAIAGPLLEYVKDIAAATGWANATNPSIKGLYTDFIKMKAGSSASIRAALEDLYESLMNNTDAVSTAVITAIETKAKYSSTANDKGEKLVFKVSKTIDATNGIDEPVGGYPADINLPDGAVALTWSGGSGDTPAVPSWQETDNTAAPSAGTWNTGTANFTGLNKYVFPASLYYRANSPVVVSNNKQETNYGTQTWAAITNTSSGLYKDGNFVTSRTQSVAIVEPIQYAVAQLKSNISIETATLKDKYGDDVKIGPTTTAGNDGTFKVTGILIGGQKDVDWQFLPSGTTTYTIYDNAIPSSNEISGTTSTVTNYTLALENTADEIVYIAIEFENNAKDFMGKDGLVAKGTKFYLVGKLQPSLGSGYASGTKDKVFKQDYVTTANFTIITNDGETGNSANYPRTGTGTPDDPYIYPGGLGAAYNVIPDLRTPLMELGLSVDLGWTEGITFNVDLGQ
ncbi:MAG: hypothetical protein J6W38_05950 [Prevotella sp.]|nr:hypothetical protein [Prevotella sp.]